MAKKPPFKITPGHRSAIRYLVGNQHVGTPVEEVATLWFNKCRRAGATFTAAKQCAKIARTEHLKNRKLYLQMRF